MAERVFNLFVYIEAGYVTGIGARSHLLDGSDIEKLAFLQAHVDADCAVAEQSPVAKRFLLSFDGFNNVSLHYDTFKMMMGLGQHLELFESIFQAEQAPESPLLVLTPIVNGTPIVEEIMHTTSSDCTRGARLESHQFVPDYMNSYMTPDGFDIPGLLNDDFFHAIRLTFNNKHYVSSMKLLISFIDTASYLALGDVVRNFQVFLDSYVDLSGLGITADELWEFRNSLLHMTNNESRKVGKGTVARVLFYVGNLPNDFPSQFDSTKYFNQMELIRAVANGISKWIVVLNSDPSMSSSFLERYSKIISDVRFHMLKSDL